MSQSRRGQEPEDRGDDRRRTACRNHQGRQPRHRRRRDHRPDRRKRLRQDHGGALADGLCAARLPDHRRRDQCQTARTWLRLSEKERAKLRGTDIAYVPQSAAAAFNPSSTIMEQVIEVTRIHKLMPPERARQRAVELFQGLVAAGPGRDRRSLSAPGFGRAIAAAGGGHGAHRRSQAGDLRRADDSTRRDDADRRAEGIQVGHAGGRDSGRLCFPRPRGRRPDRRPHRGAEGRRGAGDRHYGGNPFGSPNIPTRANCWPPSNRSRGKRMRTRMPGRSSCCVSTM